MSNQPEQLTLRPSRRKNLLALIICLAFVLIGVSTRQTSGQFSVGGLPWWAIFFLFCSIVPTLLLVPGSTLIRMDEQGFTSRNFWKTWPNTRWATVGRFWAQPTVYGPGMVLFSGLHGKYMGMLPPVWFEQFSARGLANFMNEWRERHTGT